MARTKADPKLLEARGTFRKNRKRAPAGSKSRPAFFCADGLRRPAHAQCHQDPRHCEAGEAEEDGDQGLPCADGNPLPRAGGQSSRLIEDLHAGSLIGLWPSGPRRPSPFEQTAANELEHRLEVAIAALPERLREAVLLVAVEGLQPIEAAGICGVTPEAMRQRVSRGRAALAQALDAPDGLKPAAMREATT